MMRKSVIAVLLLAMSAGLVSAMEFDYRVILLTDYYGLIDPETFYGNERMRITAAPEISLGSKWDPVHFRLSAQYFFQPFGEPMFTDPALIVREAYLGLHFGIFDLYLGQKFANQGKVDINSPLNVINHSDLDVLSLDNFFEGTLPDLMAHLVVNLNDSMNIEAVYVPFLQPSLINIESISFIDDIIIPLFPPVVPDLHYIIDVTFNKQEIPLFTQWSNSIHLSFNYYSNLFDLILAYSWYTDNLPDFDLSSINETYIFVPGPPETDEYTVTGSVTTAYNHLHNIGLGASFSISDFLINFDAALKLTADIDGTKMETKNSEFFYALQVEKTFFTNLHTQLNFFHRLIFNADAETESDLTPLIKDTVRQILDDYMLQYHPSQIYILLRMDTSFFRETVKIAGNFIYSIPENGFYFAPRITYDIDDNWQISAGSDLWWGGIREGFLGRNAEKDNYYIRAQFSF